MRMTTTRPAAGSNGLQQHLVFTALSGALLMLMYSLLRVALLVYNRELIGATSTGDLLEALVNGLRFDLRVVVFILAPLLVVMGSRRLMAARTWQLAWLSFAASLTLFLGVLELDFYREFHQRLNALVFQYLGEDPATVMSMLWHGFPVGRYLIAWALASWLLFKALQAIHRLAPPTDPALTAVTGERWYWRISVFTLCLVLAVVAARGPRAHDAHVVSIVSAGGMPLLKYLYRDVRESRYAIRAPVNAEKIKVLVDSERVYQALAEGRL